MQYKIEKKNRTLVVSEERMEYLKMTSEERLDLVEKLRMQSGKFLYEYPARLRRIIKITTKK